MSAAKQIVDNLLEASDPDDPATMLRHVKVVDGCPRCGSPDRVWGTHFVAPNGHKVQNMRCVDCGWCYVVGEEKPKITQA
jgi:hypothetical protein